MEEAPRHLSQAQVNRIQAASREWLELFVAFAYESKIQDEARWNLVPKVHQFIHLFEDCGNDFLNPYSFSGWTDEDFMGKVRTMAGASDRRTVCQTVLQGWWTHVQEQWRMLFQHMSLE